MWAEFPTRSTLYSHAGLHRESILDVVQIYLTLIIYIIAADIYHKYSMLTIHKKSQPQKSTEVMVLMYVLMNPSKMKFNPDGGRSCKTIFKKCHEGCIAS